MRVAHDCESYDGRPRGGVSGGVARGAVPESNQEKAMSYVDGFVLPVPRRKLAAYRKMALKSGKVWKEHGALDYLEAIGDDVKPGKWTSFPQSVKLKKGELVVFSYVVYKSRKDRDRVLAKVMKDPRMQSMMDPKKLPFDGKRMFWGGFKPIVSL
jgi:uncharacterized protein YbaA (DUF1428 family)